jgi:NTP pyrophosphatase (non-canonical NTP hydrolase)
MAKDLADLTTALREFARERGWEQFHSPKNLATALSVEAAELLEHFQWLNEAESRGLDPKRIADVAEEAADVQIYLLMLADKLGIDLVESATAKIEKNRSKYPANEVRGSAKKRERPLE